MTQSVQVHWICVRFHRIAHPYRVPDWQWTFWTCKETHACRRSSYVSGLKSLPMSDWASAVIMFCAVTVIDAPYFHEFRNAYPEILLKLQSGASSWSRNEWSNSSHERVVESEYGIASRPPNRRNLPAVAPVGYYRDFAHFWRDFDVHSLFWFHRVSAFKPGETRLSRWFTNPILFISEPEKRVWRS